MKSVYNPTHLSRSGNPSGLRPIENRAIILLLMAFILSASVTGVPAQEREFPHPPLLTSPEDGVEILYPGTGTEIPFAWEPVSGADAYIINVLVNLIPVIAPIRTEETSIELALNIEQSNTIVTVHWSVQAVSENVISPNPAKGLFTLNVVGTPFSTPTPLPTPAPISPPTLLLPEDGIDISLLENLQGIVFDWADVTGAARYQFTYYLDNNPIHRFTSDSSAVLTFDSQLFKIYQWCVRSVDAHGEIGTAGERFSFSIGRGILPTPTPFPVTPDLNHDNILDAADLYRFAANYRTNDPQVDFNHTGLNDRNDLLQFMELFKAGR